MRPGHNSFCFFRLHDLSFTIALFVSIRETLQVYWQKLPKSSFCQSNKLAIRLLE
jgi:hypothetical protein